ncbi:peptidyl-prolyl cis-trans isomerase FKBP4 [Trichonephila clavipes]|nr:peptidyl-prolyl cis-trans isomerase FKBP4 [Trichonephila clavipes]
MFASGDKPEARPPVFKSSSKLGTHLSTHYCRDERLSRPCPAREGNPDLWRGSFKRCIGRLVIRGLELAVTTMKKGEISVFVFHSHYAYGEEGLPPHVPPHMSLMFKIELHDWKPEDLSPTEDGKILRKIIWKGEGPLRLPGSEIKVRYTGYYKGSIFEDPI